MQVAYALRQAESGTPAAAAFLGFVHHLGGVHPGQTVLVGGGAGNIGSAVVQLAAAMGARVLATAHGAEDDAWRRACGPTEVLDYADPNLEATIRAVAPAGVESSGTPAITTASTSRWACWRTASSW